MKEIMRMILSVIGGAVTFLVLFLLAGWNILISILLCVGVYFGLYLVLKPSRRLGGKDVESLPDGEEMEKMLAEAEKDLYEIRRASQSIFDRSVQRDAENLHKTGSRILAFLKENPERIRQARRFFLYYLDTAAKLLGRYRDFQNTGLHTEEIEEILERTKKALPMLNQAFEKQFTRLMEGELMDVEADIALLEKTLKMEGGK